MHPDELGGPGSKGRITSRSEEIEPTVPVLYLDLDGTVRKGKDELGYFVNTADQVKIFPEVPELLRQYKQLGYRIVGVTNQGGIALGYMDKATCAEALAETNRQTGYAFDKIAACPHHPDATDPGMARCWCRKPKAGLIVESAIILAKKFHEIYPPHLGLMVGDMVTDAECAAAAGLDFMNAAVWRKGTHLKEMFG